MCHLRINHVVTVNSIEYDFVINCGQITVILGENGVGKTTLLKTLLGFIKPKSGSILYNDTDISLLSLRERSVIFSYVPQHFDLYQNITVRELLSISQENSISLRAPKRESDIYVNKVLTIDHLLDKRVMSLSGGELALVNISRSLVQNSKFILIDEADASLDIKNKNIYYSAIKSLAKDLNKGVLLISHNINFALNLSLEDQILFVAKTGSFIKKSNNITSDDLVNVYGVLTRILDINRKKLAYIDME